VAEAVELDVKVRVGGDSSSTAVEVRVGSYGGSTVDWGWAIRWG
jgi:hypothetical protein